MKIFNKISILSLSMSMAFVACDSEDELIEERIAENTVEVNYSEGNANFSNYVALGNSITAGLMDAALYNHGQNNSFPNIIGGQLIEAGFTASFNQPDINSENGFNTSLNDLSNAFSGPATFGRFILDTSIPGPVPTTPGDVFSFYEGNKSELNNFGVPGIRVLDVLAPNFAQLNPFYARFASDQSTSILADAIDNQPTFFSVWLGNNDVLGWALSGGSGPDGEDDPSFETNPMTARVTLTSESSFNAAYNAVINSLTASGAKGVVLTIPPVSLIPYFRAVPYNAIPLDEATAGQLNAGYANFNGGIMAYNAGQLPGQTGPPPAEAQRPLIQFSAGQNAVVITDEDLPDLSVYGIPSIRQATAEDLILLPVSQKLGEDFGNGPYGLQDPAIDSDILTKNEVAKLNQRTAIFNSTIASVASANVAVYDVNPFFLDLTGVADGVPGAVYDGVNITPDFRPTGFFSTDGIHPNARGHAIVANELIKLINSSFCLNPDTEDEVCPNIPLVNTTAYRTVLFE